MTETLIPAAQAGLTTADPTVGFRRTASALALPLAFACQLVTNALYAWSTRDGGGDTGTGEQTLAFYAAHQQEMLIAVIVSLIGGLLAIPGVLAAMKVLRPTKPLLSLSAGILMIAGYVCYFGVVMTSFDSLALAAENVDAGRALDAVQQGPAVPFFLVFVVGNLLGTLLLGLAGILSRDLTWYAGALIIGWPVGHIINITGGGEWFAVGGGVLEVAGLAFVAAAALRTPNREWARRG